MKNLLIPFVSVVMALGANAQTENVPVNQPDYNKPRIFNNLPERIILGTDKIISALSLSVGDLLNLQLTDNAAGLFSGKVISVSSKYENSIQSVVIRSSNFNEAVLTLSRITGPEGTISYTGRILSMKSGDLYELRPQGNDFVLLKKNYYDLVNE